MAKWHTETEFHGYTDKEYEIGQEVWGIGYNSKIKKHIPIKMIITEKSIEAGIWKYKYSFKFEDKNLSETDYFNKKPEYINKEDAINRSNKLNEYYESFEDK